MSEIYDINEPFDFNKLTLTKPIPVTGGNYFIKCLVNNGPLYIQPPKCKTRQGILKAGKRFYTDLLFTNEDDKFIQWMENLESNCQQFIYNNREKWFDGDMELHDIENYFTSPLKIFKSGKYYLARTNISTILGKIGLKIYDENENEVQIESINDKTNVMTILEIQGIKCSTRSFQIELEMKQLMVLKPTDLFEKCIIKTKPTNVISKSENTVNDIDFTNEIVIDTSTDNECLESIKNIDSLNNIDVSHDYHVNYNETETQFMSPNDSNDETYKTELINHHVNNDVESLKDTLDKMQPLKIENDDIQEIEFNLDEIDKTDEIQIKKRNDIYYEMYREALRKAKIARDLALSSYLEVKRIKNTYMLDDINDSDDSDDSDLELDNYIDNDNENNDKINNAN
jgi:hypothetical protein